MEEIGYAACRSQPGVYHHDTRGVRCLAHVDDVLAVGPKEQLIHLHQQLAKRYELKYELLGLDADDKREISFLGRSIRWTRQGLENEPDTKHAQALIREWGLEGSREVSSPGTVADKEGEETPRPLSEEAATRYRRGAARCNYLAQDRRHSLHDEGDDAPDVTANV